MSWEKMYDLFVSVQRTSLELSSRTHITWGVGFDTWEQQSPRHEIHTWVSVLFSCLFFCLLASSLDGGFLGDQNCMYMSQANALLFFFFSLPLYSPLLYKNFGWFPFFPFSPLDDLCCFSFFMLVVVIGEGGRAMVVKDDPFWTLIFVFEVLEKGTKKCE